MHPEDGPPAFAGLCEMWADPAKESDDPHRWLWSASIITHHGTWLVKPFEDSPEFDALVLDLTRRAV
ncbi:hypothetical protein [Actinoplanes solisilvae]|uniref:hypothetical protein n=1 Tax=Actinoplanes solisilvae TaxID=2486853 RepID=UPI000FD86F53|nr:hypothetical protein [Actinoplanes solisilvae]